MPARPIDVVSEGRQVIDRYELVAEIASGGMATVFLARLSGVGGFQRLVEIGGEVERNVHRAREPEPARGAQAWSSGANRGCVQVSRGLASRDA